MKLASIIEDHEVDENLRDEALQTPLMCYPAELAISFDSRMHQRGTVWEFMELVISFDAISECISAVLFREPAHVRSRLSRSLDGVRSLLRRATVLLENPCVGWSHSTWSTSASARYCSRTCASGGLFRSDQ